MVFTDVGGGKHVITITITVADSGAIGDGVTVTTASSPAVVEAGKPISDDVALWERERARRGRRDTHRVKKDLERIIAGCGWRTITDAKPGDFLAYLARRREAGATGRTLNKLNSILSSLLEVVRVSEIGHERPRVPVNWARQLPKSDTADATDGSRPLTWDEVTALLESMAQRTAKARKSQSEMWYRLAAYTVIAYTGLRQSEAKGLRVDQIRSGPYRIELTRQTKGKRGRTIPLTGPAVGVVAELVERAQDERLFPDAAFPQVRTLQRDVAKAGLDAEGVGFHSLRKAFAGRCAVMGVDLRTTAKVMGHVDPKLTAAIYTSFEKNNLAAQVGLIAGVTADKAVGRENFAGENLDSRGNRADTHGATSAMFKNTSTSSRSFVGLSPANRSKSRSPRGFEGPTVDREDAAPTRRDRLTDSQASGMSDAARGLQNRCSTS